MIRSLTSGISGIQNHQQRMDVIANNVANVNTIGFKTARVNFADAISATVRGSSAGIGSTASTLPLQIGQGVMTESITNQFTQAALQRTNVITDMAVTGEGFFVVRDAESNEQFVTRAGDFRRDSYGYLVSASGMRVQGYSDMGLTTLGDVLIDDTEKPATASPDATFASFAIDQSGFVKVRLTDGTVFTRGQVLLQRFNDPSYLIKEGENTYSGIASSGPLGGADSPAGQAPGTFGLGRIESGSLELANVDLATEFANMITTQRGFQANARVITTSDELLMELMNLKR
jgi:flagellar hook protein FlgE